MLIRRILLLFLALFLVTVGYHITKDDYVWKRAMDRFTRKRFPPIAPLLLIPIDISSPIPTPSSLHVKVDYHRPLHRVVSLRRRCRL